VLEYKVERFSASLPSIENSLNIAAFADWELVCVAASLAFYKRERKPLVTNAATTKAAEKGEIGDGQDDEIGKG